VVVRSGGGVSRRSNSGGAEDEELFHSCPTVESIFFFNFFLVLVAGFYGFWHLGVD